MEWYCFKDKVPMVEADIKLAYLVTEKFSRNFSFKGIKCPKCGVTYIREELAVGRLATAEGLAEGK